MFDEGYRPDLAVVDSKLTNPDAKDLAVIFPMWHGGGKAGELLVKRLSQTQAVLDYNFHDQILEPDIGRVPESFNAIKNRVVTDILTLRDEAGYRDINLVGLSLGSVALAMVAEELPDFSATLVAPGSNLALCMWEGARTQGIRVAMEQKGITEEELDSAWGILAPKNHTGAFKGKKVEMLISQTDRIIPAKYQREMYNEVAKRGALVSARKHRRLGHAATLTRFCIKG